MAGFRKTICFREKIYCHGIFPENMCKTRANGRGRLKIFAVFAKILIILLKLSRKPKELGDFRDIFGKIEMFRRSLIKINEI
jgi:hypothetical protein